MIQQFRSQPRLSHTPCRLSYIRARNVDLIFQFLDNGETDGVLFGGGGRGRECGYARLGPVFEDGGGREGEEGGDAEGKKMLRAGGEARDEVRRWVRLISVQVKKSQNYVAGGEHTQRECDALVVGQGNPNFVIPRRVQHSQSLRHPYEIIGIVNVEKSLAERRRLCNVPLVSISSPSFVGATLTLSNFFCQTTSNSLPAASIQVSTAPTSSVLIFRIYSSALGERFSNNSAASKRIAEGEAEPGRKTS